LPPAAEKLLGRIHDYNFVSCWVSSHIAEQNALAVSLKENFDGSSGDEKDKVA
jgi:hypothetical protein